jgi:tetratricopeptide (TPR) repeat protein
VSARLLVALACAALLVAAQGRRAAADDSAAERAEGRRRFEQAEQHFRKGEYQVALELYEAGYRLTRLPGFLINMAHCYRLAGDLRKARATYRKFLLVEPTSPHKAEIEEIMRGLDRALAREPDPTPPPEPRKPRIPSPRWWLWSALAASVVGTAVASSAANSALADEDKRQ